MQRQSNKIRNLHRLGAIQDAQKGVEQLQADLSEAMGEVLKKHGMKMANLVVSINAGSSQRFGGDALPGGYLNASLSAL